MADSPVVRVLGAPLASLGRWSALLPVSDEGSVRLGWWQLPLLLHLIHVPGIRSMLRHAPLHPLATFYAIGSEIAMATFCLLIFAVNLVQCARGVFKSVVRSLYRYDQASGFNNARKSKIRSLVYAMQLLVITRLVATFHWLPRETHVEYLAFIYVGTALSLNAVLVSRVVAEVHGRFAHLNRSVAEIVRKLEEDRVEPVDQRDNLPADEALAVVRWRRLHVLLGDAVHALNSCFGVQTLVLVAATLLQDIAERVFLYSLQTQPWTSRPKMNSYFKILSQLNKSVDLIWLAVTCSRAATEASKTTEILSTADLYKMPPLTRKEIKTFKLQLELESYSFSAAGLFPITVKSVLQILAVQFTYVCITLKD